MFQVELFNDMVNFPIDISQSLVQLLKIDTIIIDFPIKLTQHPFNLLPHLYHLHTLIFLLPLLHLPTDPPPILTFLSLTPRISPLYCFIHLINR